MPHLDQRKEFTSNSNTKSVPFGKPARRHTNRYYIHIYACVLRLCSCFSGVYRCSATCLYVTWHLRDVYLFVRVKCSHYRDNHSTANTQSVCVLWTLVVVVLLIWSNAAVACRNMKKYLCSGNVFFLIEADLGFADDRKWRRFGEDRE